MNVVLFGEGSGGFVVSGSADALAGLAELADRAHERVPVLPIGHVGGRALALAIGGGAGVGESGGGGEPAAIGLTLGELAGAHGRLAELFS